MTWKPQNQAVFWKRVERQMAKVGMSQGMLALKLGLTQQRIHQFLKDRDAPEARIREVCGALDIDYNLFFDNNGDDNAPG